MGVLNQIIACPWDMNLKDLVLMVPKYFAPTIAVQCVPMMNFGAALDKMKMVVMVLAIAFPKSMPKNVLDFVLSLLVLLDQSMYLGSQTLMVVLPKDFVALPKIEKSFDVVQIIQKGLTIQKS